ncbi:hypothetical protein ASPSYDRAFT_498962 [Aspergillus sydowii CBS 593.65]|uniref:Uncharacterized protein n=1 Tax=Aspergillus sydowii CBS 593.65 TaxID=1036612 RepID=A0A1L9T526_9EURO|nr:uncharacterized protein ASPSYDRAFT_498962 [Aspergillus sydowii CBS 593.65]OJJ54393.1 hypothetical protein ASPSYDRAFT_498962 [Aspergillus sydowii CBS 593.65]
MSTVVIVTGGASGIGFEICRYFLKKGDAHVVILDSNPDRGLVAVGNLTAEFCNASISFIECNAASWASQAAAFEQAHRKHGRINVVFANAGIFEKEPIYGADVTKPQEPSLSVVDVNVNGVIYSINLAVHYMAKYAPQSPSASSIPLRGQIICTSSNAGLYPFSTLPLYTASKHAVVGLVRT